MTLTRLGLAFFAALLLAACLPVSSKVPVGTTAGFKPDPMLLGLWKARGKEDDTPAYIHILGNDDGSMTAILVEPPRQQNLGNWSVYRLRVATLGNNRILNVQEVSENGKSSGDEAAKENLLLLSRTDRRGRVILYTMDEKATASAVKSGEIAGKVEEGEDGDVHITADAPRLDAFMSTRRAATLFDKELVALTRIE